MCPKRFPVCTFFSSLITVIILVSPIWLPWNVAVVGWVPISQVLGCLSDSDYALGRDLAGWQGESQAGPSARRVCPICSTTCHNHPHRNTFFHHPCTAQHCAWEIGPATCITGKWLSAWQMASHKTHAFRVIGSCGVQPELRLLWHIWRGSFIRADQILMLPISDLCMASLWDSVQLG